MHLAPTTNVSCFSMLLTWIMKDGRFVARGINDKDEMFTSVGKKISESPTGIKAMAFQIP